MQKTVFPNDHVTRLYFQKPVSRFRAIFQELSRRLDMENCVFVKSIRFSVDAKGPDGGTRKVGQRARKNVLSGSFLRVNLLVFVCVA